MRDSDGNPTGVLVDHATDLVKSQIPPLSAKRIEQALQAATKKLTQFGLTSVHDAGIGLHDSGIASETTAIYQRLAMEKALVIRVNGMLHHRSDNLYRLLESGPYTSQDGFLQINSVKVYSDGALGSSGAALSGDYSDQPGNRGLMLLTRGELERTIATIMDAGFQANTHAIGDLAIRTVLDIYQKLIANTNTRGLRHRIEHASIVANEDFQRFGELEVIAAIQPMFVPSDKEMVMVRLGEHRASMTYAWRSLLSAGAKICAGSDFPVEVPNPFHGLHAVVNRTNLENLPEGSWFPEQKLTREETFAAYTLDAAYASHQETIIGSLEPGKKADFILVDQDIFSVPDEKIANTRVLETWIGGEQKYRHFEY